MAHDPPSHTEPDQPVPSAEAYRPAPGPIPIVHEGASFVVIDKPSGLLSVPGRTPDKADCARSRVLAQYPAATGPMTVHRLDMDTSGLLVVALTADAQRHLSIQFERRRVAKVYIALLERPVQGDHGVIDLPLCKDWANRPMQKVCFEQGRPARTAYRVLDRLDDGRTRVRFEPVTGRSHQLRVHAAHELGLHSPIVGDRLYGRADSAPRLMLHAAGLTLDDPDSGERIELWSEPPF